MQHYKEASARLSPIIPRGRWVTVIGLAAALACQPLIDGNASLAEADSPIRLMVKGAEKTNFEGECTVTRQDGQEKSLEFQGEVPQTFQLEGVHIHCRLTQTSEKGPLKLIITRNGSTSRTKTQGKGSTINIRTRK